MKLDELIALLMMSPLHRRWALGEVMRLFMPPLTLGQTFVLRDEGGRLIGLATWATLTEEAERGFIDGTRPLQMADWNAGDRLWMIDWITPFGHALALRRVVERELTQRGWTMARSIRRAKGHRLTWFMHTHDRRAA